MINRYRKKPVVIEAIQYTEENEKEILLWAKNSYLGVSLNKIYENNTTNSIPQDLYIPTLEGNMIANIGDYIIKGIRGEFYPCKEDIFLQSYDII